MAKARASTDRRIPKARVIPRSRLSRVDVTRGEYNALVDILNERGIILNGLRDGLERVQRDIAIQFTRIAQLQADVDDLKKSRTKGAT